MSRPIEHHAVTEHVFRSDRHTTAYLACGPRDGTPMIFLHGWPELAIAWRSQLAFFGGLGYRCIAPDMRGYGGSSVPSDRTAYALEHIVADMLELCDELGIERAIWVAHDWGAPVAWALATHHPDTCLAVVCLSVPYFSAGFAPQNLVPFVDRAIYSEADYPSGQWDYQFAYLTAFESVTASFEANLPGTFKALMRGGLPRMRGQVARTARVTRDGGWFDGTGHAPDVPRDPILTEDDLARYVAAFEKTGFAGANAWYANPDANVAYAARRRNGGRLDLPVLFVHGAYDVVCETLDSRLADPMRRDCTDLTEGTLETGHWMMHERPEELNAMIAAWLLDRDALRARR